MASRGYIAKKDRENQKDIAEMKRQQDDIDSRRNLAGQIIGSTIGAAGRVLSKGFGGKPSSGKSKPSFLLQDPSWYNKWLSKELFTSFPKYRNFMIGVGRIDTIAHNMAGGVSIGKNTIPYVISLEYCSRLGTTAVSAASNYLLHPANAMWVKVLNELAKVNSRAVNQDSDVLGLYTMATSEIVKLLGWVKTNIEITDTFNEEQGRLRDALLKARCNNLPGVVNMFLNEKAQLKKIYNMYAHRFNDELPCIKDMAIYARRWWVSCAVIKDHAMNKAQYITFDPRSFLKLNTDVDGLTETGTSYLISLGNLQALLDEMFERIATDVDMQTLIGNIRAAVNVKDFYVLPDVVDTQLAFIDADHHALHQFHNLTTLPQTLYEALTITDFSAFEAIASDGETLSQNRGIGSSGWSAATHADFEAAAADYTEPTIKDQVALDFYTDDVDGDLINEATRLHTVFRLGNVATNGAAPYYYVSGGVTILSEGTEFIYRGTIIYWDNQSLAFDVHHVYSYMPLAGYGATPDAATLIATLKSCCDIIPYVSRIDWMFKITFGYPGDDGVTQSRYINGLRTWETSRILELANYDFDKVNQMCLMSLYYSDPKSFSSKLVR